MSMAMHVFQIAVLLLRGPHCPKNRWFGYEGGLEFWRKSPSDRPQPIVNSDPEKADGGPMAAEKMDGEEKDVKELR
jgi:hypothetical protein